MLKWLGRKIEYFTTIFKSDVLLENPTAGTRDTDKFLTLESNGQIVYRTGAEVLNDIGAGTGDITGVTAGDGLSGGGSSGSVTLNISGITVSMIAGSAIQTSSEAFSDNDTSIMSSAAIQDKILSYAYGDVTGVVAGTGLSGGGDEGDVTLNVSGVTTSELAASTLVTESEGIASNDNDTTLPTSAAVKDHVDNRYTYVFMQIHGRSSSSSANWYFMDASGDGEFNWEGDEGSLNAWDGGNSGIDNDGTNTTVGDSTLATGRDVGVMGIVVPYGCTLIGFKCIGRDLSGNDPFKAGLWSATPQIGATTDTTFTLRAVATASYAGGAGSSYNGICRLDDLTRSHSLSAGDILLPSMSESDSSRHYISMTIVLKVKIVP